MRSYNMSDLQWVFYNRDLGAGIDVDVDKEYYSFSMFYNRYSIMMEKEYVYFLLKFLTDDKTQQLMKEEMKLIEAVVLNGDTNVNTPQPQRKEVINLRGDLLNLIKKSYQER